MYIFKHQRQLLHDERIGESTKVTHLGRWEGCPVCVQEKVVGQGWDNHLTDESMLILFTILTPIALYGNIWEW